MLTHHCTYLLLPEHYTTLQAAYDQEDTCKSGQFEALPILIQEEGYIKVQKFLLQIQHLICNFWRDDNHCVEIVILLATDAELQPCRLLLDEEI